MDEQLWDEVMTVNLTGAYNCCRAAYPHMKQAGRGKIILLSSIAALRGAHICMLACSTHSSVCLSMTDLVCDVLLCVHCAVVDA